MNKNLEKEYKNYIESDLPDLWSRIEMSLPEKNNDEVKNARTNVNEEIINKSNDESDVTDSNVITFNENIDEKQSYSTSKRKKKTKRQWISIMSGVAAAILVVSVSYKLFVNGDKFASNSAMDSACAPTTESATASDDVDDCYETMCDVGDCADYCEAEDAEYEVAMDAAVDCEEEKSDEKFSGMMNSAARNNENQYKDILAEDEAYDDEKVSKDVKEIYDYCEVVNVTINSISEVDGTVVANITLIDNYGDVLKSGGNLVVNASNVAGDMNEDERSSLVGKDVTWCLCLKGESEWYVFEPEAMLDNN